MQPAPFQAATGDGILPLDELAPGLSLSMRLLREQARHFTAFNQNCSPQSNAEGHER